jgi:predicted dienelactone hydrolase
MRKRVTNVCVVVILLLSWACAARAAEAAYDPLAVKDEHRPAPLDLTVSDKGRLREIPIRVYLPAEAAPAPVVVFSHGLGGSRAGCAYLGTHWAARGYVAVFLQHPGSDTSVWENVPLGKRMDALRKAAGLDNFLLRVKDVPAVLEELARLNGLEGHALAKRLDLARVGMSGHSFGAVTTQAVGGQAFPGGVSFTEPRIKAALAMSPSSPRRGDPQQAFGGVKIPWLLMTGTKDVAAIGEADLASRLSVFPALPPGAKYELVLEGAEHSAFADRALPGDTERRNPNHHRAILALSTAFFDAYLRGNAEAKAWLDGKGPASVLEKADRWQKK